MAGRRCDVLEVREMLRRLRLGESARAVAKGLGVSRNTVREYVSWFEAEKLIPGDATALPSAAELEERLTRAEPVAQPPRLMPYRDEIAELIGAGLQVKVAWERFSSAHPDQRASYTAFRRFVRRYVDERPLRAVVRLEVGPGEESQVDFSYAGLIPRAPGEPPAKTWVFVMTLSHSRHQYVELVQDQTVGTWLALHRNAFAFFGGVPRKVVLDNLKAGIIKASVTDPEVQRAYRDCAEHYGFIISPCVPRSPEHKGKVERDVQYVKRSFLAGRTIRSLDEGNEEAID
jgi:transposase